MVVQQSDFRPLSEQGCGPRCMDCELLRSAEDVTLPIQRYYRHRLIDTGCAEDWLMQRADDVPESRKQPPGNRGQKGQVAINEIWDVVSSLAQALTEARDQLVSLMRINEGQKAQQHCQNLRRNQAQQRCPSPQRSETPRSPGRSGLRRPNSVPNCSKGAEAYGRNVHKSHAQGQVAFGLNSEFKNVHRGRSPATYSAGIRGEDRNSTGSYRARYSPPRPGRDVHMGIELTPQCNLKVRSSDGAKQSPVKISVSTSPAPSFSDCPKQHVSADKRRYCVGTQYAALLREETRHLRERRLAEENRSERQAWQHYC